MGWLHAAPKIEKVETKPRLETMADDDPLRGLPDTEYCADIVSAFHRIGKISSNGMGFSPVSWLEIEAFSRVSGIRLGQWEASQVRVMSEAYCASLSTSTDQFAPPPYVPEWLDIQQRNREAVENQFKSFKLARKAMQPRK